ncbi:hypothetical protein [Mucilaginibacter sp.]|uniref:hypothetical protein n=1 Tax=Mucilaginibacter sp. TaxID=1882438 RepID=UPI003D14707F
MEVLQLRNLIFISQPGNSYYMIDTNKKYVKAIEEDCYNLIEGLLALKQDIKAFR